MFSPFDPNWILYGVALLVAVASVRPMLRAAQRRRTRDSGEDDGPMLVFPLHQAPFRPAAEVPNIQSELPPLHVVPAGRQDVPAWRQDNAPPDIEPDGTVQLLPGRLEILTGPDSGRSIPFVRLPGRTIPEITIGRAEGSLYHHVQIDDLTVSRLHARLRLDSKRWTIVNLSRTNPVRVNGRELPYEQDAVRLSNGDRIQLGTVELRFREGAA